MTRKTPLKKRKVAKSSTLRNQADRLAQARCVAKGHCEASGQDGVVCSPRLEWAHILSRRYMAIRHDENNSCSLCWSHHFLYSQSPDLWYLFIERTYPGRWAYLRGMLQANEKIDTTFYKRVLERLQASKAYDCSGCHRTIYLTPDVAETVDNRPYCDMCGRG